MTVNFDALDPSISHQLAINLDAAEADELVAYQDTLGNWTIGRGHLLPPHAPGATWKGFTIIQSTSDRFFNGDILIAVKYAQSLPEWGKLDTQNRKDADCELAFNMSHRWGNQFAPTRALIAAQDWQAVHDHLLGSLWAKQVKDGRATRVANMFLNG